MRLGTLIGFDAYGYFVDLKIWKKDVADLIKIGVNPEYINNNFILRVGLTNKTSVTFNGIRLNDFNNDLVRKIPLSSIIIKEICLKKYSKKTRKGTRQCYATKMIFTIPSIRKIL